MGTLLPRTPRFGEESEASAWDGNAGGDLRNPTPPRHRAGPIVTRNARVGALRDRMNRFAS